MNAAIEYPLHVVGDQAPVGMGLGAVDCCVCMNAQERGVNLIVTCQHPAVVCVTCLTHMLVLENPSCPVCRGVVHADIFVILPRVNRYINQLKRQEAAAQTESTRKDATIRALTEALRARNENRARDDRVIAEARAQLRHAREEQQANQQQAQQARAQELQQDRARRLENRAVLQPVVVNVRNVRRRFAADLEDVWAPGGDDSTSEEGEEDEEDSSSSVH